MLICVHGRQMIPEGERGVYFICQLEEAFKGNHCRYTKWCPVEKKYDAMVDRNGNMCAFFSTKEPAIKKSVKKTVSRPVKKTTSKSSPILSKKEDEKSGEENSSKSLKEDLKNKQNE